MVRLMTQDAYKNSLKFMHCEVVLRICEDDQFEIVTHELRQRHGQRQEAARVYLSCAEKINYCQYAQDVLNETRNSSPLDELDQLRQYQTHLDAVISHLRFQQKVIDSLSDRLVYLLEQQGRYSHNAEISVKLQKQIEQVEKAREVCG